MQHLLCEIFKKNYVISNSKVGHHNHHVDVMTIFIVSLLFGCIKLKIGVRDKFRLLISNFN